MSERPKLLRVLAGEALSPPPIWIMRQAGRYLPEYRETRRKAGSFLDLCFTPELAAEVTLQPVRRFGFDAAILFSDILVVPHALGQTVRFEEGHGPVLDPVRGGFGCARPQRRAGAARSRSSRRSGGCATELAPDKALIGFCGAPWTVATYMVGGRGTPDQLPARRWRLSSRQSSAALIDLLVEASADYLIAQLEAGADAVKIFDSWAGILDEQGFRDLGDRAGPRRSSRGCKAAVPGARIIAFPRGAGARLGDYARETGADCVAVDWTLPMRQARELVAPPVALQGNLDPLRLKIGGRALDEGIDAILEAMAGRAHIFNLGHGITPDVPVEHVAQLVDRVRSWTPC